MLERIENMIKPIVKDVFFLGQKSDPATTVDIQTGQDLQDTLKANETRCVGMAANMIGVKKRIIVGKSEDADTFRKFVDQAIVVETRL